MPIWTALLAVAFLGERLGAARIVAVVLGLVGVAVIVRPGLEHVDPGQLIALAAAVGFAISMILVKSLTATESTVAIIFWMLVVQSVIGIVPAVLVWRTPSAAVWPWILVIALCGTYSHFCMTQALRHAEATMIVPMDFLRVPLTAARAGSSTPRRSTVFTVAGAAPDPVRQPPEPASPEPRPERLPEWRRRHERVSLPAATPRPHASRAGAGCPRRAPGSTTRSCSRSASSSSARSAG